MTIKKTLLLAVALGVVAAPAWAQESPAPFSPVAVAGGGFGGTGQWVLSLGGTASSYAFFRKQSGGGWQLQILPAADYFIASSISVGGVVGFQHDSGGTTPVTIGARAGFNLNISGPIGWWPLAGIFATHTFQNRAPDDNSATLRIFAPFLYHLVPHFFVGLGPSFDLSLTSDGNAYGFDVVLGGWI